MRHYPAGFAGSIGQRVRAGRAFHQSMPRSLGGDHDPGYEFWRVFGRGRQCQHHDEQPGWLDHGRAGQSIDDDSGDDLDLQCRQYPGPRLRQLRLQPGTAKSAATTGRAWRQYTARQSTPQHTGVRVERRWIPGGDRAGCG